MSSSSKMLSHQLSPHRTQNNSNEANEEKIKWHHSQCSPWAPAPQFSLPAFTETAAAGKMGGASGRTTAPGPCLSHFAAILTAAPSVLMQGSRSSELQEDGRQEGKWSGSVDVRGRPHHGRSRWRLPRREDNEGIKPTPNALLGEKDKRRELTAKLPNAEGFRRPSPSPSAVPKPGSQAAACPKGVSEASKKGYSWIEGHLLTKSSAEDS